MFPSFLTEDISVEKALPEYVAGDESAVQICSLTDFVDGCVHWWQERSHLCLVVGQELHGFLDEAREDSVLPSFPTGLIAGGVTGRMLG